MVVHVEIKVHSKLNNSVEKLTVLVNGGAHSPKPVLVVDENIAKKLGFTRGEKRKAATVDAERNVYVVKNILTLKLVDNEEELAETIADLVVHPGLEEPLITDATIDMLGIKVESFYKGIWRHVNDPPGKRRGPIH